MNNPFEAIEAKLSGIEKLLLELKQPLSQTDEPKDSLMTVEGAADFLSLTVPTIYSKVSKGEIPFMKQSKRLYFSRQELTNYIKKGRKKTNAEVLAEADTYLKK